MSKKKSTSGNNSFDRSKAILKAVQGTQENLNPEQQDNLKLLLQNYGEKVVDTKN